MPTVNSGANSSAKIKRCGVTTNLKQKGSITMKKANLKAIVKTAAEYRTDLDHAVDTVNNLPVDCPASDKEKALANMQTAVDLLKTAIVMEYCNNLMDLPDNVARWDKYLADGCRVSAFKVRKPSKVCDRYTIESVGVPVTYEHVNKTFKFCKSEQTLSAYLSSFIANLADRASKNLDTNRLIANDNVERKGIFAYQSNTKMLEQLQMIVNTMTPENAEPVKMFGIDFNMIEELSKKSFANTNGVGIQIGQETMLKNRIMLCIHTRKHNRKYALLSKANAHKN